MPDVRRLLPVLLLCAGGLALFSPAPVRAQAGAPVPAEAAQPVAPVAEAAAPVTDEARAEAGQRFTRALQLYEEGLLDQALVEFRRAYEIAPAPPVLFNLGHVYAALGRALESAEVFEQYLREMGDALPPEQRAEVEAEVRRQRSRIAHLDIHAEPAGATVWIDNVDRGPVTAEPLAVTAGTLMLEIRAPGHQTFQTAVRIAAGLTERIDATLEPIQAAIGRIRVVCGMPGATITVNGEEVGTSPLTDTLAVAPGVYRVEATRSGYLAASAEVDVAAAEQEEVELSPSLDLEQAGTLRLRLPVPATRLWIDGEEVDTAGDVRLAEGAHALMLEVPERLRHRGEITIRSRETLEHIPRLVWADLEERLAGARQQRIDGWITTATGGAFFAAGAAVVLVWFTGRSEADACTRSGACVDGRGSGALGDWAQTDGVGWSVALGAPLVGVGLVLMTVGLGVVFGSSGDAEVSESSASFSVSLGLGSVIARGEF